MNRVLAFLLVVALAFSLAACGGEVEAATSAQVPVSEIMAKIESVAKDNLDYFAIKGDETAIFVNMAINGIAEEVVIASDLGYDETSEPWASNRVGVLNIYFLFEEIIKTNGRSDLSLVVNLVNDTNYENVLLSVYNGEVVYDEMAVRSGHVQGKQD